VTHAQTWASYSALYRFGRLSLVAVIKAHRNGKTNLNAKTNPNPHLQKTCKKKLKEKR